MSYIDWIVLFVTLASIVIYGLYKSRGQKTIESYFKGNNSLPWYTVGLSVMATQASAITFLSAPGQAYTDGMRFVQYYFGLPIAMIVICVVFIPRYHKLNVYTAYEFLENRFDLKTRSLTALLFLIQRGLATGLTIYAPSIILSSILGWNIYYTNMIIGGVVLLYTYSGGTRAVSYTQMGQMAIILVGMVAAGVIIVQLMPEEIGFGDALRIGGKLGHMNIIDTEFDLNNKYNIWSGIIGGFFLALSYFGTDQSQVGRYISGKSINQIRLGLIFNGALKIPMQFFILLIGILLLAFYQFEKQPLFFNSVEQTKVLNSPYADEYNLLEAELTDIHRLKKDKTFELVQAMQLKENIKVDQLSTQIKNHQSEIQELRDKAIVIIKKNDSLADTNDTNYIFLDFVTKYLPHGLIGLLIAVIFSASMSSTSSELNALASTSVIDIYRRSLNKDKSASHYLKSSKYATLIWGILAIGVASIASELGSLIEAVNVLGSLFYGTVLGIFLTAFFIKWVKGTPVFIAALFAQASVFYFYFFTELGFLWFNLLGAGIVMILSIIFQLFSAKAPSSE
jgi:solute:Na+ symporter, SSS family